ncbi:MAG: hypothetical protein EBX37_13120, partial [Alphaproteobacteria bacterium]|nr:hypothetical protein [Alphaproteobacteria bacterium]
MLNDDTILFDAFPLKIFYRIDKPQNECSQYDLKLIAFHLNIFLDDRLSRLRLLNDINRKVVTKENFPLREIHEYLDVLPPSPMTAMTPMASTSVPLYHLSRKGYLSLVDRFESLMIVPTQPQASLIDWIPPQLILANGKDVRMFHGTNETNLKSIMQKIKPLGKGTLGPAFYMTPSVKTARFYAVRSCKSLKSNQMAVHVILELVVKDAASLLCKNIDKKAMIAQWKDRTIAQLTDTTLERNAPVLTQTFTKSSKYAWQFIMRRQ